MSGSFGDFAVTVQSLEDKLRELGQFCSDELNASFGCMNDNIKDYLQTAWEFFAATKEQVENVRAAFDEEAIAETMGGFSDRAEGL